MKPERRPPVYFSAFHEQAAEVAGRLADGAWTLADPRKAPAVIAAYRRGAEEAGREPGEVVVQTLVSWAPSDDAAQTIVSSDPEKHVKQIETMQKLGATAICVMNMSGADPHGTIRTYGEHVLPELRR